jgi:hypothetical protein|tara:strand:+ start:160880 stop:160993 length:114 start_codon:yes stop_codon:yes gene_type:complete
MTTGEVIVLALLGAGLICSITLFVWLVRMLRKDRSNK